MRVALIAALAVVAAATAPLLARVLPDELSQRFKPGAVLPILNILATGMLAVSTFSLNVMVSAHRAAAAQATPRAHRILLADTTTQSVLATFIGAFVYSLTAIILFQSNMIAPGTSVVMMGVTVLVVVLVILAMLRWIDHLSELGSMDNTLKATEAEAEPSLMQSRQSPALGGSILTDDTILPTDAHPVVAHRTGYVQFIDMPSLNEAMEGDQAALYLTIGPGDFVLEGQVVAQAAGLDADAIKALAQHIVLGDVRTFEQDAAYGLLVLSEIASRALSSGINDPGTAIDVIARQERLLWHWANAPITTAAQPYPRIFARKISADNLVESAFASIARDGAGMIEVVVRLQSALATLADGPEEDLRQAARKMTAHTREYAAGALTLESEKARVAETG